MCSEGGNIKRILKERMAQAKSLIKTSSMINSSPFSWERQGHTNVVVLREWFLVLFYCCSCLTDEGQFKIQLQGRPPRAECRMLGLGGLSLHVLRSTACSVNTRLPPSRLLPCPAAPAPLLSLQQGEVDCWPLPCPEAECEFSLLPEGECCPRCVTDPCQADTIRNDITKTCLDEMNVVRFTGSSWIKHGTECTLCQCKVRPFHPGRQLLARCSPSSETGMAQPGQGDVFHFLFIVPGQVGSGDQLCQFQG